MLDPKFIRFVVHIDWQCKHCRQIFGSENVNHYGVKMPDRMVQPTWFFASMSLLDHLRDCQHKDYSDELRKEFGDDFLNHGNIRKWFEVHATLDRRLLAEQELDDQ